MLAAVEAAVRTDMPAPAVSAALTVALAPTLLWRRSKPLLMLAIAFGVGAVSPLLTGGVTPQNYTMVFLVLLPFSLVRWGSGREIVLGAGVVVARLALTAATTDQGLSEAAGGLAVLSAVAAVGVALRYRSAAGARELERVRSQEREQLARDLHDTVAHHVSAMAIRAQAGLAVAQARPEAAAEALRVIEAEASRALAAMRSMVRVLRCDEPADYRPAPVADDLRRLGEPAGHGTPVNVRIDGDLETLPAPLSTAIYRMAQESVTNAQRHARQASRVDVRVAVQQEAVRLRVSDDGQPNPGATTGYGMTGMRERTQLLGGDFSAGPDPAGGWTVAVLLPLTGPAA